MAHTEPYAPTIRCGVGAECRHAFPAHGGRRAVRRHPLRLGDDLDCRCEVRRGPGRDALIGERFQEPRDRQAAAVLAPPAVGSTWLVPAIPLSE